jgi:hypothetical protein
LGSIVALIRNGLDCLLVYFPQIDSPENGIVNQSTRHFDPSVVRFASTRRPAFPVNEDKAGVGIRI